MAEKTIINEMTNLREVNKKVYLMNDGSYKAVYYPTAIHTLNEETGTYEEIVNTLSDETVTTDTSQSYVGIINYDEDVATNDTAAEIGFVYDTNSTEYSRKYISHLQISLPTLQNNPNIKRVTLALNELTDECSMTEHITAVGMYSYNSEEDYNKSINNCMDYFSHSHFSDAKPLLDITKQAVEFYHQLSQDSTENNQNYFEVILKMEDLTLSSPVTEGTKLTCRYSVNLEIEYKSSYVINTSRSVHRHNIGRFGTGYIDLISGNLMFESEDFAWCGNKTPVTIRHLYNSSLSNVPYSANTDILLNVADYSNMNIGNGWKLNLMQSMVKIGDNYIFTDEYGTETAFIFKEDENNTSVYESEDGLKFDESTNILDFGEEKYHFDTAGRLIKIADSYNEINITYTDGKITTVTDGAGRIFTFDYTNNHLTSITAPDDSVINYSYTENCLNTVTYSDGRKAEIIYNNYKPCSVTIYDTDNNPIYQIGYSFYDNELFCISEYNLLDGELIETCSTYYNVTNHVGDDDFDLRSTTIKTSRYDDFFKQIIFKEYIFIYDSDGNKISEYKVTESEGLIEVESNEGVDPYYDNICTTVNSANYISHGNFSVTDFSEQNVNQNNWYALDSSKTDGITVIEDEKEAKYGCKVVKLSDGCGICQKATFNKGINTLSAYIKVVKESNEKNHGAYFYVTDNEGNIYSLSDTITKIDDEYVRLSTSFYYYGIGFICLFSKGDCAAYFNGIQLENKQFATEYNLIENSNFSKNVVLQGSIKERCGANSTVYIKTAKETRESFTLSGWAKANSLSTIERAVENPATFRLRAKIYYASGNEEEFISDFSPDTTNWQNTSITFEKSRFEEISKLEIYCDYDYNIGTVNFENICLVRNSIETDLTEDDFPDLTEEDTTDTENAETESAEAENEFSEITDKFGNPLTDTTFNDGELGTFYRSFGYNYSIDENGTVDETKSGNDLIYETDSRGNVTTYIVDEARSRNKAIIDRLGVRTNYEYDNAGRTTKVTNVKKCGHELANVSYEYDALDNLTEINRGDDMGYTLKYNDFNKLESIGVNGLGTALVKYTYKNGNGRIQRVDYANGDYMTLLYNGYGQMYEEWWYDISKNETAFYKYTYDIDGNITRSIDILNQKEYNYYYNEGNLVCSKEYSFVEYDSPFIFGKSIINTMRFIYNNDGELIRKRISFNDGTEQVIEYENPEDGSPIVKFTADGNTVTTLSKSDGFGRKVFDELQTGVGVISRKFDYLPGKISNTHIQNKNAKSTPTTQLVSKITFSDGRTIEYEYDKEERITKITDSVDGITEYTYDCLGQLLTEKHKGVEDKYFITVNSMYYDNYGDITYKNGVYYEYDKVWKDKLIYCSDHDFDCSNNTNRLGTIEYDAQGNPINYFGNILTWEKGIQLKSFNNIAYTYNANGIRTSKFVDGIEHSYMLDGTKILRETWNDNVLIPLYDNEENVCGICFNGTAYYFQKNLQGDIIAITGKYGSVLARYRYDAWGVCTVVEDTTDCGIARINPYRYRGYYFDNEIGMYYLQSRYYDPRIGRFLNADVPELATIDQNVISHNLFGYCGNEPVDRVDYFGCWYQEIASIPNCKVLDDFLCAIDDYVYDNKNTWYKRLIYGTAKTIIGSVKKYNIGNAYSVVSIVLDSLPKLNDELNTIRYYSNKIKNKYFSSAYRYTIFLLFGSHNMQYKLNVLKKDHVISTTIIEFRVNGVYTVLRDILKKLKVKMVKLNVKWKYYYK